MTQLSPLIEGFQSPILVTKRKCLCSRGRRRRKCQFVVWAHAGPAGRPRKMDMKVQPKCWPSSWWVQPENCLLSLIGSEWCGISSGYSMGKYDLSDVKIWLENYFSSSRKRVMCRPRWVRLAGGSNKRIIFLARGSECCVISDIIIIHKTCLIHSIIWYVSKWNPIQW